MAKQTHHQEPTSSKGALAAMAIGALLVAGLVVWALTRTVEAPATTTSTATTATEASGGFVPSSTTAPVTETAPVTTGTPVASTTTTPLTATPTPPALTPPTTPHAEPSGDRSAVKRISAEDLREKMKAGNVVIVDVRDAGSYQTSHIAGALHIPMSSIQSNLDLIPKTKEVVTYCT